MFIRSKYHDTPINITDTVLKTVQSNDHVSRGVDDCITGKFTVSMHGELSITFIYFTNEEIKIVFKNREQRDSEYEWSLSKLDCVVNEDDKI